ncbi:MAG: DinB family protein, partial [Bryobacteraceae bacterium]
VRTFAEVLGHIADAQYSICGGAVSAKPRTVSIEKTQKTKEGLIPALKEAFAYCDEIWSGMTAAKMLETAKMFGGEKTRVSILDFNTGHTYEHYGNLATYMRIKRIVPPSSEDGH